MKNNKPSNKEKKATRRPIEVVRDFDEKHQKGCPKLDKNSSKNWVRCTCK